MNSAGKLLPEQRNRPTRYGYRRSVVADWCELIPGDSVLLLGPEGEPDYKGTVDAVLPDGTIVWLILDNGCGRRLFHHADGHQALVYPARSKT